MSTRAAAFLVCALVTGADAFSEGATAPAAGHTWVASVEWIDAEASGSGEAGSLSWIRSPASGPVLALGLSRRRMAEARWWVADASTVLRPSDTALFTLGVRAGTGEDATGRTDPEEFDFLDLQARAGWAPDTRWILSTGVRWIELDGSTTLVDPTLEWSSVEGWSARARWTVAVDGDGETDLVDASVAFPVGAPGRTLRVGGATGRLGRETRHDLPAAEPGRLRQLFAVLTLPLGRRAPRAEALLALDRTDVDDQSREAWTIALRWRPRSGGRSE